MWARCGSTAALTGVVTGYSGRGSWPSLNTRIVTNNAEEFPSGESRIEDVVYWSSIVGFSPKGKGVFTSRLKKKRRRHEIIIPI